MSWQGHRLSPAGTVLPLLAQGKELSGAGGFILFLLFGTILLVLSAEFSSCFKMGEVALNTFSFEFSSFVF